MVTKEQERKALEQIKKIIEGLGADSYIATAMDGMIEDAEENIENDFGLSMKDRWQTERENANKYRIERDNLKLEADSQKRQAESNWKVAEENAEDCKHWMERAKVNADKNAELIEELARKQSIIDKREDEIIRLKAKLYDMICK